jgi:2-dehydropantoate 2-reductase
LRLEEAGADVTLLARGETYRSLEEKGIEIVDGLTGERQAGRVNLVRDLRYDDLYELAIVAMGKRARRDILPALGWCRSLEHVLLLGNDVSGGRDALDYLPREKVLLGFPGAGGGWVGDDLIFLDREKRGGKRGTIYLGEMEGEARERTRDVGRVFGDAGIRVSLENDMDGWLKYHFAFMAPTAGIILKRGGPSSVAQDADAIHEYCRACREAGDVLREIGHVRRQPFIFNLYYWVPRWMEPVFFSHLFRSRMAEVGIGLHARVVGPELLCLAREFALLKEESGLETPTLDDLLRDVQGKEVAA